MSEEAEKLYTLIIDGDYDSRLKTSLERIKKVCDDIEAHGGRIYVGRVGRLCVEKFEGPTAQSIRNKPETLRKYVDLRATGNKLPRETENINWKTVSDPKTRVLLTLQKATIEDRDNEIKRLKTLLATIAPLEMDKLLADSSANNADILYPPSREGISSNEKQHNPELSDVAHRAIKKIIDEDHLRKVGLRFYNGYVLSQTNFTFLEEEEVLALLDLLKTNKHAEDQELISYHAK